jgi:arsenite methyltransferase
MSGMLEFDEAITRSVEAAYLTPEMVAQRRTVIAALDPRPGERVLDIGSGPGLMAAEIAAAVGAEGVVHGVDRSASMLAMAARRELPPGAAPIRLDAGEATALPLPDASFDAVISTQVYEYVEDMPAALAEARRVLVPGGRLLVMDSDWDSLVWHSTDPERMDRVMRAWDEHLAHRDLPRKLPRLLRDGGFALVTCAALPLLDVGDRDDGFSRSLVRVVGDFVTGRQGISAEEVAAWAADVRAMGEDGFFSLNRYLFLATRG